MGTIMTLPVSIHTVFSQILIEVRASISFSHYDPASIVPGFYCTVLGAL